ncbi:hypothetical protein JW859_10325 [bacterium]|nr:hypothetical protein [bacterium]
MLLLYAIVFGTVAAILASYFSDEVILVGGLFVICVIILLFSHYQAKYDLVTKSVADFAYRRMQPPPNPVRRESRGIADFRRAILDELGLIQSYYAAAMGLCVAILMIYIAQLGMQEFNPGLALAFVVGTIIASLLLIHWQTTLKQQYDQQIAAAGLVIKLVSQPEEFLSIFRFTPWPLSQMLLGNPPRQVKGYTRLLLRNLQWYLEPPRLNLGPSTPYLICAHLLMTGLLLSDLTAGLGETARQLMYVGTQALLMGALIAGAVRAYKRLLLAREFSEHASAHLAGEDLQDS